MTRRRTARRLALAPLAAFLLASTGCGYNTIQQYDEQANAAQGQIQAQLQRRADLIPNLVNTVKGYAQHEEAVFTQVAQARAGLLAANQSGDPEQMANADAQVRAALRPLLVVAEAYPQLKADQGFLRLQDELTGTENRIATSRNDYNEAVRQYNTYIKQFPAALTAKATGKTEKKYYQATSAAANEAPTVDFSRPAAPATKRP